MRRYLFSSLLVLALAATIPALALAHSGDHGRDRHDRGRDRFELRHRHHRRDHRVEHFRAHAVAPGKAAADAGTVKSFKAGVLTVALANGSTATGRVNNNTNVQCDSMNNSFTRDDGGPGPSSQGGGDRGDSAGGDRGDGNDQAEDRGDRNDANDNDANDDNGNDANDANDSDANDDNGNAGQSCAMALRTPGTHVRDATLTLTGSGAVWDRVDLDV